MSEVSVPIKSVTPANANGKPIGPPVTNLPPLAKCDWAEQDLSAEGAGRVESGRMLKKRIAIADRLDLEWSYLTRAETAMVLQTFKKHEYILVEYLDPSLGDWRTEHFYVGDRRVTGWKGYLERHERIYVPIIRATPDKG